MTEKAVATKIWCPFYIGVRLIWMFVLRASTVALYIINVYKMTKLGLTPKMYSGFSSQQFIQKTQSFFPKPGYLNTHLRMRCGEKLNFGD